MPFPLVSIPVYVDPQKATHEVPFMDQTIKSGWHMKESKGCTLSLLVMSFISGIGLVGFGCIGAFSSFFPFQLHQGIYFATALAGAAITIPLFVALKLGFKTGEKNQEKLEDSNTAEEIQKQKETFGHLIPIGSYSKTTLSDQTIYFAGWIKENGDPHKISKVCKNHSEEEAAHTWMRANSLNYFNASDIST